MVAEQRTAGHRSSTEIHPKGMTDFMILAPIFRVQRQALTPTGGGDSLTTSHLFGMISDQAAANP